MASTSSAATRKAARQAKNAPQAKPVEGEVVGIPQEGITAFIRIGKGVSDTTDRLVGRQDVVLFEVDAESELNARGLPHDGAHNFSIDYYLPLESTSFYWELDVMVTNHKTYGPLWAIIRKKLYDADKFEEKNWDSKEDPASSIRAQVVDQLGGGGVLTQGLLRILAAFVGRPYEPNEYIMSADGVPTDKRNPNYDMRDDRARHSNLRTRKVGTKRVSLMVDMIDAIVLSGANLVALLGGAEGATGSSGVIAFTEVFSPMKQFTTIPLILLALPEWFLVEGSIAPEHSDRFTVITKILRKMIAVAGMGERGMFFEVIRDNIRRWGGEYSNVNKPAMLRGCAPVLTVVIIPERGDLEPRFLMHLIVTLRLSDNEDPELAKKEALQEAKTRVLQYARPADPKDKKLSLIAVEQGNDWGVEIKVDNPKHLTIDEYTYILPALAELQRQAASVTLPVIIKEKVVTTGFFGGKKIKEVPTERQKPLIRIPLLQALARGVGKSTVTEMAEEIGYWTLLKLEETLIGRHSTATIDKAFTTIFGSEDGKTPGEFATVVKERLYNTLFAKKYGNPTPKTYKDPTTVVVWGQVDVSASVLPDLIFSTVFADVDRSKEDLARMQRDEQARHDHQDQQVARLMTQLEQRPELLKLLEEGEGNG